MGAVLKVERDVHDHDALGLGARATPRRGPAPTGGPRQATSRRVRVWSAHGNAATQTGRTDDACSMEHA